MSLYRAYRPKSLEDIAGQQHVVSTLMQAVRQDRLAHAYLFAGTRGTGKTSTARILAGIILTRGITDETRKRQILEAMENDSLVDMTEIDAASNRGIDDVRQLLEKIHFTPVVAAAKVFIIDEVHMLTKEAFNALLKTLEEPPPHAFFILATTELHKIPPTIQSRCQRFLFHAIREEDIVARLRFIAEKEAISIDDEALHTIARHVQGGLRDAVSLLDQLRSLPQITVEDVHQRIGAAGHQHATHVLQAIRSGNTEEIVRIVRQLEQDGSSLEHMLRLLLADVRRMLHEAVERKRDIAFAAHALNVLLETAAHLRNSPLPSLTLESALLSLCTGMQSSESPTTVATNTSAPSTPAAKATPAVTTGTPATKKPAPPMTQDSGDFSLASVRSAWHDILEKVQPASARMSLKNGSVHSVEGNTLHLRFASSFHCTKAKDPAGQDSLRQELKKRYDQDIDVECTVDTSATPTPPAAVDLAGAVNDVFSA